MGWWSVLCILLPCACTLHRRLWNPATLHRTRRYTRWMDGHHPDSPGKQVWTAVSLSLLTWGCLGVPLLCRTPMLLYALHWGVSRRGSLASGIFQGLRVDSEVWWHGDLVSSFFNIWLLKNETWVCLVMVQHRYLLYMRSSGCFHFNVYTKIIYFFPLCT